MENDDIPMPSPPARLRALLMSALVRAEQAERHRRLSARLSAMSKPEAEAQRLYAVLLTESSVSEKVCAALKQSCGCTAVAAVGDRAWVVEAPGGLHKDLRDKLNEAVERHYSVFVLELGAHLSWAYQEKDKGVNDLLVKYPQKGA